MLALASGRTGTWTTCRRPPDRCFRTARFGHHVTNHAVSEDRHVADEVTVRGWGSSATCLAAEQRVEERPGDRVRRRAPWPRSRRSLRSRRSWRRRHEVAITTPPSHQRSWRRSTIASGSTSGLGLTNDVRTCTAGFRMDPASSKIPDIDMNVGCPAGDGQPRPTGAVDSRRVGMLAIARRRFAAIGTLAAAASTVGPVVGVGHSSTAGRTFSAKRVSASISNGGCRLRMTCSHPGFAVRTQHGDHSVRVSGDDARSHLVVGASSSPLVPGDQVRRAVWPAGELREDVRRCAEARPPSDRPPRASGRVGR